ncbi:MAG: protein kinase, partial [Planctomycetota bacterium]
MIDDQAFLDDVLDRALSGASGGAPVPVDELVRERPHLRAEVERLLGIARDVTVLRPLGSPEVGGYEILREIGRGAMGTVYLARQRSLAGRPVALKVMTFSALLSRRARDRFLAEARALARLRHPHVVAVHDVVEQGDLCAYAMEWIQGTTLAQVISALRAAREGDPREVPFAEQGLSPQGPNTLFFCRVGIEIARALQQVHDAGLIHRDVKPSNILLREDGAALLADFGLVRDRESATHTQTGLFVGSPAYASPEQLCGEHEKLDARTDVYGLGVTLYEAFCLKRPYSGSGPTELARRIEAGLAEPLRRVNPKFPKDVETVVTAAMDPDPARRYSSAEALAEDLERVVHLQPIKARRTRMLVRASKALRRNRLALVGAVIGSVLALMLAAALALYLDYRAGIPERVRVLVQRARLALLDPVQGERMFIGVMHGWDAGTPQYNGDTKAALEAYDDALRLRDDERLQIEREVVSIARSLEKDEAFDERAARFLDERCPLTARVAKAWGAPTRDAPSSDELLATSPLDRRSLGLLAFLRADADLCNRAWAELDVEIGEDALVDGSLGELYLALEDAALAYPRLLSASAHFPETGFLCVDAADAAVRVGDLAQARRLLGRAPGLGHHDPFETVKRVQADYAAKTGDLEQARTLYEHMRWNHRAPTAHLHYALFLEARGELPEALEILTPLVSRRLQSPRYGKALVRIADAWWAGLDTAQQRDWLRQALDHPSGPPPDLA